MDTRTRQLIDALEHPGAALVFQLQVNGPMTQEELLEVVDDASKATANRRLEELGKLGLLTRAPGPRQYKDRPWSIAVRPSVDSFLSAAMEMARAAGEKEEADRVAAEGELEKARKDRSKLASLPSVSEGKP